MGRGTKQTYQPSKRRRVRRHGFLARKRKGSSNVLQSRRRKGRKQIAPTS